MKPILAFILAAFALPAHAEFITGEILFRLMDGDQRAQDQALGYIVGVHDATMGGAHCSHQSLTGAALRDMTRQMLHEAGPMRALTADVLVSSMLKEAFPCKENSPAAAPAQQRGRLTT